MDVMIAALCYIFQLRLLLKWRKFKIEITHWSAAANFQLLKVNNSQKKNQKVTEPKTENKTNNREENLKDEKDKKQKQGEGISNGNLTSI